MLPVIALGSVSLNAVQNGYAATVLEIHSAANLNPTNITGLEWFTRILASPWSRIFTETINAGLSLINGTWSLTRMIKSACVCQDDARFFQVDFIFAHLRLAGFAFGQVMATFDPNLLFVASDLVAIPLYALEIIIQMLVVFVFYNVYTAGMG